VGAASVWARIEGLPLAKICRRGGQGRLALPASHGALGCCGCGGILWMVPATRATHSPVLAKRVPSATAQPGPDAARVVSQGIISRARDAPAEAKRLAWRCRWCRRRSSMPILC